jgi:MoaA/NifB/PqqE/SkfB family radical SAM enzyme
MEIPDGYMGLIRMLSKAIRMTKRVVLRESPSIENIWFEVTDRCNSRCSNCAIWSTPNTKNLLSPEEIGKMFSDPVFRNVRTIVNSGGEPTTRADIYDVLVAEHKALPNAELQLSTNGLQPSIAVSVVERLLQEYPDIRLDVGTSLDGIGDDHDKVRGVPGNFERVVSLIDQLVVLREKYGRDRLKIGFGIVLTEDTVDRIKAVESFAREKDVGMLIQWYNQSEFYSNAGKPVPDDVREKMKQVVRDADYTITSDLWCDWLDGKKVSFNCMTLRGFCAIKCNGDIVPCLNFWNNKLGNVRDNTPSNILKRKGGVTCYNQCLNSWGTFWSFEADPIQYARYFARHPIKLVRKLIT